MKTSHEIMLFLLKNFEKEFNINQIAKRISRRPSGVFKELVELKNKNIVVSKKIGNAKIYSLNLENLEARKLCELILISERREKLLSSPMASVVSKDLVVLEKISDVVVLFGSVLKRGEPRDIDVFVVTKPRLVENVEKVCREISRVHNKNVSPLILSYLEFVRSLKNKDEVIFDAIKNGIVLSGYEEFVEGIRNGKV